MKSAIRSADIAQNTPPPVIETKGPPITGSLNALSVVMAVVAAVALIKFLLHRTHAKRGFAFGTMRRLYRPLDHVHPVDLLWRPRDQVEADDDFVLRAAQKALDAIAEAEAEPSFSTSNRMRIGGETEKTESKKLPDPAPDQVDQHHDENGEQHGDDKKIAEDFDRNFTAAFGHQ
jgi:hypothetical protein